MRGSGEIPNGLGMAQLCPILNAPSMRPVAHRTLSRCRDRLAAFAAWVRERCFGLSLGMDLISAMLECVGDCVHIVKKYFGVIFVKWR